MIARRFVSIVGDSFVLIVLELMVTAPRNVKVFVDGKEDLL
jgi:hypothetical protein